MGFKFVVGVVSLAFMSQVGMARVGGTGLASDSAMKTLRAPANGINLACLKESDGSDRYVPDVRFSLGKGQRHRFQFDARSYEECDKYIKGIFEKQQKAISEGNEYLDLKFDTKGELISAIPAVDDRGPKLASLSDSVSCQYTSNAKAVDLSATNCKQNVYSRQMNCSEDGLDIIVTGVCAKNMAAVDCYSGQQLASAVPRRMRPTQKQRGIN